MIRKFLIALILFTGVQVSAQKTINKPKPSQPKGLAFFDNTAYNFGLIDEHNGKVVSKFYFTNRGKANLTIKSVDASCGCTVPEWPKGIIKPGETGMITAEYDPLNRVGPFSKTLTVSTDGDPAVLFLTLSGEVFQQSKEVTSIFPFKQGNLRFTNYSLNMKPILESAVDSITYTIYNASKRDMFITRVMTPEHIRAKVVHDILVPGNSTDIIYYFDAAKAKDLGPRTDETFVYTNDDTLQKKYVTLKTTILQDFKNIDKATASKIVFKEMTHDLGEVYLDEVVSHEFEFTNKGKSNLLIRKAQPNCGCTVSSFSKEPIAKNKTGKIKVTFNASGLRGLQDKSVLIYTNDPANPVITLKIKAKVVIPGVDPISGK